VVVLAALLDSFGAEPVSADGCRSPVKHGNSRCRRNSGQQDTDRRYLRHIELDDTVKRLAAPRAHTNYPSETRDMLRR
jgi:hypothetical protein